MSNYKITGKKSFVKKLYLKKFISKIYFRIDQEDPIYDGPEGYDQYPAYPGGNQYGDYSGDAYPQYYGPAYDDYHADYEEYPYDYYGDAYGDYYGPAYYDYNEAYGNNYESGGDHNNGYIII